MPLQLVSFLCGTTCGTAADYDYSTATDVSLPTDPPVSGSFYEALSGGYSCAGNIDYYQYTYAEPFDLCTVTEGTTSVSKYLCANSCGQALPEHWTCPDPSPTEDPCFPSAASVTKADGSSARLDVLKPGDAIVAVDAEGVLTTGTVSLVSIDKPDAETTTFVNITTASTTASKSLLLTEGHHLPVGEACCTSLKKAKNVAVGEIVWLVSGKATSASVVIKKALTKGKGLHSPVMTNGAFPVVDGFVTAFASMSQMTLAKYGLEYLEGICSATGTCSLLTAIVAPEK